MPDSQERAAGPPGPLTGSTTGSRTWDLPPASQGNEEEPRARTGENRLAIPASTRDTRKPKGAPSTRKQPERPDMSITAGQVPIKTTRPGLESRTSELRPGEVFGRFRRSEACQGACLADSPNSPAREKNTRSPGAAR